MAKTTKRPATLSEELRAAIADNSLSINRLAIESGVDQAVLQRFVTGERDLRLGSAEKIAAYLGLHLAKWDKAK